jgi:hypothetical protein
MEHRGIEFVVRARPGKNEWTWTIYPAGAVASEGNFKGARKRAVLAACAAIDKWLKRRGTGFTAT